MKFYGVSLNNVSLSGPKSCVNDSNGVLLRFRKDAVGIIADIEQKFYRFLVTEDGITGIVIMIQTKNKLNME